MDYFTTQDLALIRLGLYALQGETQGDLDFQIVNDTDGADDSRKLLSDIVVLQRKVDTLIQ